MQLVMCPIQQPGQNGMPKIKNIDAPPKRGYLGPITIKGIPILIHWSFPLGGIFIAFFLGDLSWATAIPLVLAYTTLILIHELGHVLAARMFSLDVHLLLVSAAGGWCFAECPSSVTSKVAFYGGGIIAQLVLLAVTVIYLILYGNPSSVFINSFVLVFTVVNVVILVVNILPAEGTDGKKLWTILGGNG